MPTRVTRARKPTVRAEARRELADMAKEHAEAALATLVAIATTGDSEAARVSAANSILDRGYVQLTWAHNYERADKELGLRGELIRNYDLALRPDIAAPILMRGMEEGWFTGKKLADYLTLTKTDYRNARRIVNGMDRAALIAGHAERFEAAIVAAGAALLPRQPDDPGVAVAPPRRGAFRALLDALGALLRILWR